MVAPLLIGTGIALSAFGKFQSDRAQAKAERENAEFLREQAKFIEFATQRQLEISENNAEILEGEQILGFAASNVDLSGSALDVMNESFKLAEEELVDIAVNGAIQKREALLKARSADKKADDLTSFTNTFATFTGAGLQTASLTR